MFYSTPEFDLLIGNHNLDYACLHAIYDVGMKDDTGFTQGIAHLAEHIIEMQFMSDGSFCVEANAFLNKEYTCFYSKCLVENSHKSLKIQNELIEKSICLISDAIVQNEKKRILDENRIALKNTRLSNVLKIESLAFDNVLKTPTYITPELFLQISTQDLIQFIVEKYSKKPCIVYSGGISDMKFLDLSPIENNCLKTDKHILGKCITYNNLFCLYFDELKCSNEYFNLKILMEYYCHVWNCTHKNIMLSNTIKLFDSKTLLLFEFRDFVEYEFFAFLCSNDFNFERHYKFVYEKVLLEYLCKFQNLSSLNLFIYKTYRYFKEDDFNYGSIKKIISSICHNSIEAIHNSLIRKILENSQGEINEIFK